MLSDISIIIRSEDNIDNTPKQEHIRASLNYDKKVEYAHLPVILNTNGKKMSIDDDGASVKWLLEQGYLPESILHYLISMDNEPSREIFTMEDAIEWFDLSKVSNSPISFDINKLKKINQNYLKNLDAKELSRYVGFADTEIGELARTYLNECSTTVELKAKIAPIFCECNVPEEFAIQIELMKKTIKNAPYFEEYDEFEAYIMDKSGLKGDKFNTPLRIILTNSSAGPDITEIYKYLKNYIGEIVK
jgi:glutamyl-tRNA synthetase